MATDSRELMNNIDQNPNVGFATFKDNYALRPEVPVGCGEPHTIAYLDYQKYGFNGFEVLKL